MTRPSSELAVSIAERIHDWSRQEQGLIETLSGSRSADCATARSTLVLLQERSQPELHPDQRRFGPGIDAQWVPAFRDSQALVLTDCFVPVDSDATRWTPVTGPEMHDLATQCSPGPFDEMIGAISQTTRTGGRSGPLPSPRRFMVRVARLERTGRATKRNYDYFEELDARLADLSRGKGPSR